MLKATLKKLNMSGMGWACHCKDALMDYLILSPSEADHMSQNGWSVTTHPTFFSQGDFDPNSLIKRESMFLLLEFERADNDRSNVTGPLRISHKRWCHFLLVLLKMLSCWRKFKLPMWKDHIERPHIGAVSDNPAEFPTDRKQTPGILSDKISRWLQSPAFESPPSLGSSKLRAWML